MSIRSSRTTAVAFVTLATFADILAYSICVPVLPDFARRLGASPAEIGLMFASFGVTLLAISVPMGAISDRTGRKLPLVTGMLTLAGSTMMFATADSLTMLFAARMIQGAADGVTWVVGFALIADCYGPEDRGRVMGYVMSGTSFGIIVGPSIGGWLYQAGGVALPFEFVAVIALVCAAGFAFLRPQTPGDRSTRQSIWSVVRVPSVALCALVVVLAASTIAMLEPVLPLFFDRRLGLTPAQIGLLFGIAAVASTLMPLIYGPLIHRWGARRLTLTGLVLTAAWLPMMATASGFSSAVALIVVQWIAIALFVTPSLAYMGEVTAFAGGDAYGIGYGMYNSAWAVGLLSGPALGGWLFDRIGFGALAAGWSIVVILATIALGRLQLHSPQRAKVGGVRL
jgi:MFS transporter, DHA1 family, solute carrier family 18 (vesicular amine transporter), member 1/2